MMICHLLLCVYILTFILGFPANILAFRTFCIKLRHEPTPMDILLLNLSISDLIFLTFLPLKMKEAADDMEWNMSYFLCKVSNFSFFFCIYISALFLTAVAVERYLAVIFPFQYLAWRRPCYTVIVSVLIWLLTAINMSMASILFPHPDNVTADNASFAAPLVPQHRCKEYPHDQQKIIIFWRFELFLVLFLTPFLICCFCYINLIRVLSRLPKITRKHRLRAVGMAVVTLLVFTVCFAPYNISHVVGYVHGKTEGWRDLALMFTTLNACLDPMIFYFSSSTVREAISCCLQGLMKKTAHHLLTTTSVQGKALTTAPARCDVPTPLPQNLNIDILQADLEF
ncbi:free fatty acid receptor 3-like [Sardina pilchardus]|uniref:free fatty acid receptor 3-like n=1 Tax=Sardina pilchardus TaxID=27697 RepID=UPI002E13AB20